MPSEAESGALGGSGDDGGLHEVAGGLIGKLMGRERGGARGAAAYVAAFGKHPGWNDHIDDLGIESDVLVEVKRLLYVEGIGHAIDSGRWDGLEVDQRIERFAHVFLLRRPAELVVGRFWSSVDGKGRAKYPMVVCAHLHGVEVAKGFALAMPLLERLEERCRATEDRDGVIGAVSESRSRLRTAVEELGEQETELEVDPGVLGRLAEAEALGPAREGFYRVLYQIEREMAPSTGGGGRSRGGGAAETSSHHVRVPKCGSDAGEALMSWLSLFLTRLDPSSRLLLVAPLTHDWVDVVVGEATGAQLFFLRASTEAVPLTTQIPYTLEPGFLESASSLVEVASGAGPIRIPMEMSRRQGAPQHPVLGTRLL